MLIRMNPTLLQMAVNKVAEKFLKEFGLQLCERVFKEIQAGDSSTSSQGTPEHLQESYNKAKQRAWRIPVYVRKWMLDTIHGLNSTIEKWKEDHGAFYFTPTEKIPFQWRSDGTINRTETARQLILKEDLPIKDRFETACMYCFEENIGNLWLELQSFIEAENSRCLRFNSLELFWIEKLKMSQYESKVHWTQDLLEKLSMFPEVVPVLSNFLPSLLKEERQKCLQVLRYTSIEDLRQCLYAMTNREAEVFIKNNTSEVLRLYLQWPFQDLYMDAAEKMWTCMSEWDLNQILIELGFLKESFDKRQTNFDYGKLFAEFWNNCPKHLKECMTPEMRKKVVSFI